MKIKPYLVVDTNIIVSAVLSKTSKARKALDKAQNMGIVLMSYSVLDELKEVLSRPKFDKYVTRLERQFFLNNFLKTIEFIEVPELIGVCRDPKDDKILALAVSGKAKYIITGGQDLLILNPFQEITIITLEKFLMKIKG